MPRKPVSKKVNHPAKSSPQTQMIKELIDLGVRKYKGNLPDGTPVEFELVPLRPAPVTMGSELNLPKLDDEEVDFDEKQFQTFYSGQGDQ